VYIFKEAALQTKDRINLKPDLVILHQGRVHGDGGNLLQVKRGYFLPIVLGSRGANLKATTEGTSSPHNYRPQHNCHYFLNSPKKLHPTILWLHGLQCYYWPLICI